MNTVYREVRRWDPITLDELVEVAALQTRVDRKYVLPAFELKAVLDSLAHSDPRVLELAGARSSRYESVYFDTPDLLSYRMAALARRRRFKLRTRNYVDSAESYLELKTRGARNTTVKGRIVHDIAQRDALTPAGRLYADAALERLGLIHPERLELSPTLVTRYDRTTLYLTGSGSRATIDTELSWHASDGSELALPQLAIVESKSGSRTSEMDRALWAHGHRPATISKFGTGLAALRPDLPSNKWARVLRRHFAKDAR
jgi:hypothetical protein